MADDARQSSPGTTPYPAKDPAASPAADAGRTYDAIIIGAGPAGLSAAIYLARYNRSVAVIDFGEGRSTSHETNENYLGFPEGVPARDLRDLGVKQASRFGAHFIDAKVDSIQRSRAAEDPIFIAHCGDEAWRGRALIIATGVVDSFPDIPDVEDYVGRSLFWCITCDGWKTRGKRVAVVGATDEAATTCMQFRNFTQDLVFVTNREPGAAELSEKSRSRLAGAGIPIVEGEIACAEGEHGMIRVVRMKDGRAVEAEIMVSQQGSTPNSALASELGVVLDSDGYIHIDAEQRTNIPHLYAAGDVTKEFAHQIATAVHEGATAAQTANYDLYGPDQRDD